MLVYIAGSMKQGHRIHNIKNAIDVAERIALRGHTPYIPHLNDFWELCYTQHDYEFWMRMYFEIIKRCDAVIRIPGASEDADREVLFALVEAKIPVFIGLESFMSSQEWTQI